MAEPHSSAIGAVAGAAAAAPAALFLGAHVDALIIGLMAAVFSSIWLPTVDDKVKAFASVCLSALLAGYGAPIAVANAASVVPGIVLAPDQARPLLAVVIGAVCPLLVPVLLNKLKSKGEAL